MDYIEKDYSDSMEHDITDYLLACMNTDYFERLPRQQLYYEDYSAKNALGTIVICHSFCENAEKYKEFIYYLLLNHYHVFIVEHRGHGRSFRQITDPYLVHVEQFNDYILDLYEFITKIVKPSSYGLPLYLYGHSMGCMIALGFLELYPNIFKKAILSSPVFSFQPKDISRSKALFMRLIGRGSSPLQEKKFSPYSDSDSFEKSFASSMQRYQYYRMKKESSPEFQTVGFSYTWIYEFLKAKKYILSKKMCRRIHIPILIALAQQDPFLSLDEIEHLESFLRISKRIIIPDTKHDIYESPSSALKVLFQECIENFLKDSPPHEDD